MNEYKITYSGESEGYRIITDRTETDAKRFFRKDAKELGLGCITIERVELLSTNALASKRNERETLETIRQLVADLGPQSYLATAFEGCFEIAEQNIEFDFGDSMKGRVESAERKLDETAAKAKEKIAALEAELRKAQHGIDELIQKDDEYKASLEKMSAKTLSGDDLEDIRQLLEDRATDADEAAAKAADEIIKYANRPESKDFQNAVRLHRHYSKNAEYTRNLLDRVVATQAVFHAQEPEEGQAA